jgi:hypothetical protein
MIVQVIAQGLVDNINRLTVVVPKKMFDVFQHEESYIRPERRGYELAFIAACQMPSRSGRLRVGKTLL